jgi:hypothetical protein
MQEHDLKQSFYDTQNEEPINPEASKLQILLMIKI